MKKYIAASIIALAVFAAYAPSVQDAFVWDDTALILRDPLIRSWRLIPEGFNHFLFVDATASDFYRPVQRLIYTLEYAAFTFRPGPYHITSIFVHAAAAVALFFFAEELLLAFGLDERRRGWIALIGALAWAIHPVQSAAVVYVSGRADPLAAAFGFLGCYLILRSARDTGRSPFAWLLAAGASLLLSALSRETGLLFPLLAIVLLVFLKRPRAASKTAIVTAFVCAVYLSLRLAAEHSPAPTERTPALLATRPIAVARAFAEYAGLILLPVNLHMDREIDASLGSSPEAGMRRFAWRELQTLLGILLLTLFIYWLIRARRTAPPVFALLILAAISYLPVSGIILLNASVAEHWIYIPSAFLFLAAALAITQFLETHPVRHRMRRGLPVALACWMAFLGARTFLRTFDWKDQRTFLERTISSGGDSARMLINLGGLELAAGHIDKAKKYLAMALHKEPDQPIALINLAALALQQNDFGNARKLLMRATKMPVVDAQAHEMLAVLENKEHGRADLLRLRLAARTGTPNWSIEKRYIQLIDETGATPTAIKELQGCLQTQWYRAESWELLSRLLTKIGKDKEASDALAQAAAYDVHLNEHGNLL